MAVRAFLQKQETMPKKTEDKNSRADKENANAETVFVCSGFKGDADITLTDQLLFKVYRGHFAEDLKRNSTRLKIRDTQKGTFLLVLSPPLRTQDCPIFTSKLEEEWETVQLRDGRTRRQMQMAQRFGDNLRRRKLDQATGGEIARAITAASSSDSAMMSHTASAKAGREEGDKKHQRTEWRRRTE